MAAEGSYLSLFILNNQQVWNDFDKIAVKRLNKLSEFCLRSRLHIKESAFQILFFYDTKQKSVIFVIKKWRLPPPPPHTHTHTHTPLAERAIGGAQYKTTKRERRVTQNKCPSSLFCRPHHYYCHHSCGLYWEHRIPANTLYVKAYV